VTAGALDGFQHDQEPHLRALGMPTALKQGADVVRCVLCDTRVGVIQLLADYQICSAGDTLSPEQCRLLVRIPL